MTPEFNELDTVMEAQIFFKEAAPLPASDLSLSEYFEFVLDREEAFNTIMKDVVLAEVSHYVNNDEVLYESKSNKPKEVIGKLVSGIVKWLSSVLDRVGSIFKAALNKIHDVITNNKVFLHANEKYILNCPENEIELHNVRAFYTLTGTPYIHPEVYKTKFDNDLSKSLPNDYVEKEKQKILDSIATPYMQHSTFKPNSSIGHVRRWARQMYGGNVKTTYKFNVNQQYEILKDTDKQVRQLNAQYKPVVAEIKTMIACFKAMKKVANSEASNVLRAYIEVAKYNAGILHTVFFEYTRAMVDRTKIARLVCAKAVEISKKSMNESTVDSLDLRTKTLDEFLV